MELIQRRSRLILQTEIQSSLRLAIPSILTQFAETAIGFVDTVMMGWLGSESLAAGGLGVILLYLFIDISKGLFDGLGAIAAEVFAREDIEQLRKLTVQGLWLCLILSLPMMLTIWHLGSILTRLGQEEQIVRLATIYLRAIVWGLPAALGLIALKEIATSCDRPQFFTLVTVISIILNGFVNDILMFGHLGFPALGLAGAGWSSTIIFWLTFAIVVGYMQCHADFQQYQLFKILWYGDRELFLKILKIGVPIGIKYGVELIMFAWAALLMGYLGTESLAAHEIAKSIFELAIVIPWGLSYSTVVRVGQRFGLNDRKGIENALSIDLFLSAILATLIALIIWLFSRQIISIYLDSSSVNYTEIVRIAVSLLGMAALCQGVYALNSIAISALNGLQDTLVPMWIDISVYGSIGMGGSYFLAIILGWAAVSIWWILTLAVMITTGILIWRLFYVLSQNRKLAVISMNNKQ
ncbi:MAG: MATE family efflux transporter [Spirulina sp.]